MLTISFGAGIHSIMNQEEAEKIIREHLAGHETEAGRKLIDTWYHSFPDKEMHLSASEKQALKLKMLGRIKANIPKPAEREEPSKTPSFSRNWQRMAASVALLLTVLAGWWFLVLRRPAQALTYREYYVPTGQTRRLTLSDGSRVYLNADTRLKAPISFLGDTRSVFLEGEAFFEVAKNPDHPFIIHTGKVQTQVLGTSFNVKAYRNEEQEVAVLTGKVSVRDALSSVVLFPNQKAAYEKTTGKLTQTFVANASDYRAWTAGKLIFEKKSLKEIAATLNRHYGVQIALENEGLQSCLINAEFEHEPVEKVLAYLCGFLGARYKQTGKQILIKGGSCQ